MCMIKIWSIFDFRRPIYQFGLLSTPYSSCLPMPDKVGIFKGCNTNMKEFDTSCTRQVIKCRSNESKFKLLCDVEF